MEGVSQFIDITFKYQYLAKYIQYPTEYPTFDQFGIIIRCIIRDGRWPLWTPYSRIKKQIFARKSG